MTSTLSETKMNRVIKRLLVEAKDKLIISTADDGVKVGPYMIVQDGNTFIIMMNGVDIDEFNSKKAAIAYAISLYNRAPTDRIRQYDAKIGKFRNDIRFYRRSLMLAQKKHDDVKENIMLCRIDAAFRDLSTTKQRLLEEIKNIQIA